MNKKVAAVIIFLAFVLSGTAYLMTKSKGNGITKVIQGSETIVLDVWIDELASQKPDLVKKDDYVDIMIRNRPHGKLKITEAVCEDLPIESHYVKKFGVGITSSSMKVQPKFYQCRIKLEDKGALVTANGYLSHGNQVKIFSRVDLEGKLYQAKGYIVDINEVK